MSSHDLGQQRFVDRFWGRSRLHFIGTWKERYEALLATLAEERAARGERERSAEEPPTGPGGFKAIMHVDMDAFFASVSLRDKPELRDKPVVVTSTDQGKSGEISCANYPARAFGVKAGMWMARARLLCPGLVAVAYDFGQYMEVAETVYRLLFDVGPFVNALSCDEAFMDVTHVVADEPDAAARETALMALAESVRARIRTATGGCTASIGIGSNMLLARIATARAKPDGVFRLRLDTPEGAALLSGLDIKQLPQIGYKLSKQLRTKLNVHTCGALQRVPVARLKELFGDKKGMMISATARGEDPRPWRQQGDKPRQSVGAQISWGVRTKDANEVDEFVTSLTSELAKRFRKSQLGAAACRVTLSVWRAKPDADPRFSKGHLGHGQCDILSRSMVLSVGVSTAADFRRHALQLFKKTQVTPEQVRGMGVSCSDFTSEAAGAKSVASYFQQQSSSKPSTSDDAGAQHEFPESPEKELSEPSDSPIASSDSPPAVVVDCTDGTATSATASAAADSPFDCVVRLLDQTALALHDRAPGARPKRKRNGCPPFCTGATCGSSACQRSEALSGVCEELYKSCQRLERHEALQLVQACQVYARYRWPDLAQSFSDACSQLVGDLVELS